MSYTGFPGLRFNNTSGGNKDILVKVLFPDTNTFTSLGGAFHGCKNLSFINETTFLSATDINNAWRDCTSLSTFPFMNFPAASSFMGTWQNCTSLTAFPAINFSNFRFVSAWSNCASLSYFPPCNFSSSPLSFVYIPPTSRDPAQAFVNFRSAWQGCTNLRTFDVSTIRTDTAIVTAYGYGATPRPEPNTDTFNTFYFDRAWLNCTSLSSFNVAAFNTGSTKMWVVNFQVGPRPVPYPNFTDIGYSFVQTWQNCESLLSFPEILEFETYDYSNYFAAWKDCTNLKTFQPKKIDGVVKSAWENCRSIQSFNLTSFSPRVEPNVDSLVSLFKTFANCTSLTSIPLEPGVDYRFGDLTSTFEGCTSLSSFPLVANLGEGRWRTNCTFANTWANCFSFVSFPNITFFRGINSYRNAHNVAGAWRNCYQMNTFGPTLLCRVNNLSATWENCISLTSFPPIDIRSYPTSVSTDTGPVPRPSDIPFNTVLAVNFNSTWARCVNLSAEGSFQFRTDTFERVLDGTRCFADVTLDPQTWSAILTSLALSASRFPERPVFDGGNSKYYSWATTARNTLTTLGWTIIDGGSFSWNDALTWDDGNIWQE